MPEPTQPPQTDPPQNPPDDKQVEENFWKRLEDTIDKRIDEGVKRHLKRTPGEQRTGRTTFRDMLADFMGGPFKPPEK